MRRAIRTHARDFAAIVVLLVVAIAVTAYILGNQRFTPPGWVPIIGSDVVERRMEISTAQALMPGQGQEVAIAGVKVGEIAKVELKGGRALVTMRIQREHAKLHYDATALVRPKTGLADMTIQLDPGTSEAGEAPDDWVIPVSQTRPTVNFDEILAALDADTRDYLRILLGDLGRGLKGRSNDLANTFRRFEPTSRNIEEITKLLARRRDHIERAIGNFRLLTEAVAGKDEDLAQLVAASDEVFRAFVAQDRALRRTLQDLPETLRVAQESLGKAGDLADALGPTLESLRPAARALGPSLKQTRPFLQESTPIIETQLRPFARESLPTARLLRPAARDLAQVTPDLTSALKVVNVLLNELAYNPPGDEEGYLFWAAWTNHAGASIFGAQDAMGAIRRGIVLASCSTLQTLPALVPANPRLGTLINLLNPVSAEEACAGQGGAGATLPTTGTGTTGAGTTGTGATAATATEEEG
ncbi:MAG: MCE family protein [Solirubrobacteraceae bacterium]|nr:MCE family protein [Solirubrobacteraceae bacterium]